MGFLPVPLALALACFGVPVLRREGVEDVVGPELDAVGVGSWR